MHRPSASHPATTSATTHVTLSGAPAASAGRERVHGGAGVGQRQSRGDGLVRTQSLSPSLHSSKRSPGTVGRTWTSAATASPLPCRALTMTCRWGWCLRRLGRELSDLDEELDERVIPGELLEHAVEQAVGAGVADVHERDGVVVQQQGGHRRAHARPARVALDRRGPAGTRRTRPRRRCRARSPAARCAVEVQRRRGSRSRWPPRRTRRRPCRRRRRAAGADVGGVLVRRAGAARGGWRPPRPGRWSRGAVECDACHVEAIMSRPSCRDGAALREDVP